MFVLNETQRKPETLTLIAGTGGKDALTLTVRPPETAALIAGRQARRAASDAGAEGADLDLAFVLGVACWATLDWSGVGDAKGKAVAFDPERLAKLLRQSPAAYVAFDRDYVTPMLLAGAEKNGSSPSRNGISGRAAKPTAKRARSRSAAKPAPTAKTSLKPSRASGSGASSKGAKAS